MQYLTRLSASPTEPISLQAMLTMLRVDADSPDVNRVADLITAARTWAERYQRSALAAEQFRLRLDHFPFFLLNPGGVFYDAQPEWRGFWGLPFGLDAAGSLQRRFAIELPMQPVVSIDSFTYLDTTKTPQTLDPSAYQLLAADDAAALLYPADNTWWPATYFDPAAITIDFTAGTATPSPHTLTALRMMVCAWYEDPAGRQEIPPAAKSLLSIDRAFKF